jgi:hypothetical protein
MKKALEDKPMNKKRYLVIAVIVVAVVLLAILLDAMLANHLPAITSLEAVPDKVITWGSCQIACNASDLDGDELSYEWSATAGEINGEGATVTWTAPSSAGSYNVIVWVTDGRGGEVVSQVTIAVRTNMPPIITSLVADADWTTPSDTLQVTCTAVDVDGDKLSYEWLTDGGDISGTENEVIWTAPKEVGIYHITVVVADGHGCSDTRMLSPMVATQQPPIIENLLITKERYGHCYLKEYSGGYYVGKGKMYDIECIVSDMSGRVSYVWSCTGGEISGTSEDGSMITWIAPNISGNVTVTVIVSDIAGNMVIKNISLTVVSCSTCTFRSCTG